MARKRTGFAAAVPVLAAFPTARANDHDQAVVTVQVSAADHELAEGYYQFLARQRGHRATITLGENGGRQLSRLTAVSGRTARAARSPGRRCCWGWRRRQ